MEDLASLGFRIDTGGLRRGAGDLDRFGNSGDRVDRTATRLNSRTFPALISVVGVAAAALGGLTFGRIIRDTAAFESSIARLGVVSGGTAEQMAKLEKQARELGATTLFTAQETANAQTFLAQAGFSAQEILKATPGIFSSWPPLQPLTLPPRLTLLLTCCQGLALKLLS